jgi:hypothetical protein
MQLTALQAELSRRLRTAVETNPNRRIVYCTEWLGYLPFGLYHWLDADGQDISRTFPWGWSRCDLEVLEREGVLAKIDEWTNPNDECETKTTYEVTLP